MRRWPLHAVFAVILIGSFAAKYQTADLLAGHVNFALAVLHVARAQGLTFRNDTTIGDTDTHALVFDVPGCARQVLVLFLLTTFDQEPIARSAREPGYILRYVYIDRSWDKPNPLAVVTQRVKYSALEAFGLSQSVPSGNLLLLEFPAECHLGNDIDWRMAWSRNFLDAVEAATDPVNPHEMIGKSFGSMRH
jgi:hypothetical protein